MMRIPRVTIESVSFARGDGTKDLWALTREVLSSVPSNGVGGVIAATFSNSQRFPALSIRAASELHLPTGTPAFDLQLACSAYPYAVYLAGRLAADLGKRVLVLDGDVQSALVNPQDHATGTIFSDAVTASVVSSAPSGADSVFDFGSAYDGAALSCAERGPIQMDGMKVFSFVATEVRTFLKNFIRENRAFLPAPDFAFVPHQAQPYMIRQLAKALELEEELKTLPEEVRNPGSASIPLTLAMREVEGPVLMAGFGAGYSMGAGIVDVKR